MSAFQLKGMYVPRWQAMQPRNQVLAPRPARDMMHEIHIPVGGLTKTPLGIGQHGVTTISSTDCVLDISFLNISINIKISLHPPSNHCAAIDIQLQSAGSHSITNISIYPTFLLSQP